jgi:hypothetical protein
LDNNDFAVDVLDFINNYSLSAGDLSRPSSYGEVLRNGQPTIVITDYGLNDEVYNTYYNRNQRHQMYEIFDLSGNDDILSDIGGDKDIRNGMWALIPSDVSNNNEDINENYVEFINKHNTYPESAIFGLPVLNDMFHDCVNNLKQYLISVSDSKKFYQNLLSLQEYLIRENYYDKEPLIIRMNNATKPTLQENYDRNTADSIAKKIAYQEGFQKLDYIDSGKHGIAYDVGDGKVLKITGDKSEAVENLKLIGKPLEYIAQPYKVYSIESKDGIPETYAIILEKLKTDTPKFEKLRWRMDYIFIHFFGVIFADVIDYYMYGDNPGDKINEKKIEKYMRKNPNDAMYFYGILKIASEAQKYGVESMDYLNAKNLGIKKW